MKIANNRTVSFVPVISVGIQTKNENRRKCGDFSIQDI